MNKPEVQKLIQAKAYKYGIDADFLDAIVRVESDYNYLAQNPRTGAQGLGQLMPVTIQEYENFTGNKVLNPLEPETNLEISSWYIGKRIPQMLKAYGRSVNVRNVVWSYNAGIGKLIKGTLPEETKDYFRKVDLTYPFLQYGNHSPLKKKVFVNSIGSDGLAPVYIKEHPFARKSRLAPR